MAGASEQEKTEEPSPRKLEEAKRKGEVARSREVAIAMTMLAGATLFAVAGGYLTGNLAELTRWMFSNSAGIEISPANLQPLILKIAAGLMPVLLPLFGAVFITALFANIIQVGFMLTGEPVIPKFSRVNPLSGLKRIFSWQGLQELFKSVFKITVIGYLVYTTLRDEFSFIPLLTQTEVSEVLAYILEISLKVSFKCIFAVVIMAAMDYAFQRWNFRRRMMMTRQEVKDELKQREGDPLVKGRIRRMQHERARQRMMAAVPTADVVVTNPTRVAVALRYEEERMNAPRVIAKGQRLVAQRIREIAAENNIVVVERPELAWSLYETVEIGDEISPELYKAVAEVLAYVYSLRERAGGAVIPPRDMP